MRKRLLTGMTVIALILSSCGSAANNRSEESTVETESQTVTDKGEKKSVKNIDYELPKPGSFYSGGSEYVPLEVNANIPDIKIQSGLSNIENLDQFGNLNDKQKEMIEKNGFVVNPTSREQLFYIYEDNTYNKIPNFITTDSVLQLYHIFYDYTLRQTESEKLYTEIKQLNSNMVDILTKKYNEASKKHKAVLGRTLAYFAVCEKLLGVEVSSDFPQEVKPIVEEEYSNIKSESQAISPITGAAVDYSFFKVRGHYTRSDTLKEYFGAMSMYGVMPFNFYDEFGAKNEDGAYMSIIATGALQELPSEKGMDLWEDVYVITEFFVGSTNDINPLEWETVVKSVYGKIPQVDEIEDKIDDLYDEIDKLGAARITNGATGATGICFRFMGQRYIPDSEILDRLSNELRPFPSGVDVMAVLGSERAEELLDSIYKPSKQWSGYKEEYDKVKSEFSSRSMYNKTKNIYATWLFTLESLNKSFPKGYPDFMRNTAWEDKSLATALGSWAELRHDTILYGAQSGVECGGGDEAPELLGYVEPNPEFYNRLIWLTNQTKEGLSQRDGISDSMKNKCESIVELLEFLKSCSIKELNEESLTYEEYDTLLTYGGLLEYLSSSIAEVSDWYLIESDTDKKMAQIADVHSAMSDGGVSYLEVGVGNAAEIYVAVLISGKLYLTRGAVFDYFEFTSQSRLTDEEWQEDLNNKKDRPPFISNYMQEDEGAEIVTPAIPYSSGC